MTTQRNEAWVKEQIKNMLKARDIWYFMPQGTNYGVTGIPDFVCCCRGKFVGIEAKVARNNPTALQDMQMARINKAGGVTMVVNELNLDKAAEWLDTL